MDPTGEDRPEVPTRTADEWLEAVLRSERRGELLTAFDLAERGLVEHPEDVRMRYHAVLVLARTGATTQAMQWCGAFDLSSADS
jgi:hypothetical protein